MTFPANLAAAILMAGFFSMAAQAQPALSDQAASVSPAELARRQAQATEAAECRKAARALKGNRNTRETARLKCEATFEEQRASWNDRSKQLP